MIEAAGAVPRRKPQKAPNGGFSILTFIVVALATVALCALGAWQVQRLQWKTELLSRMAALRFSPAEPLNVALNHLQAGRDVDLIRVQTACEPAPPAPAARIYTVTGDGPGWRPIIMCRLKDGPYPAVLLDLGIESDADRPKHLALSAPATVTGVLRMPLKHAPMMAMNPTTPGEFGWRDARGVIRYLESPQAAPVFLLLEAPAAAPNIKPAPTPTDIPNNHLGYAITWFGLALALIGVYVAALLRRRKQAV